MIKSNEGESFKIGMHIYEFFWAYRLIFPIHQWWIHLVGHPQVLPSYRRRLIFPEVIKLNVV
jgi:hypothetical protein